MRWSRWLVGALGAVSWPALAQPAEAPLPDPGTARDNWTVALGVGYTPDYVGSDDYRLIPAAAIRGTIGPVAISTRSTYLYADFIPRGEGIDFDFGPIVGVRLNRTGKIKDDFVDLLPERKRAIEVGGFAGVSLHNLTNPYDTLAFGVDVLHDIAKAHKSTMISPNVELLHPAVAQDLRERVGRRRIRRPTVRRLLFLDHARRRARQRPSGV